MYLFLCVSVLCLMFLCVIPVLCLWALLPELKLMMMMIYVQKIIVRLAEVTLCSTKLNSGLKCAQSMNVQMRVCLL